MFNKIMYTLVIPPIWMDSQRVFPSPYTSENYSYFPPPWIHRGYFLVPIQLETTHSFLLHGFTEGISQSLYNWKLLTLSSSMDSQRVFPSPYTTGNYSLFPPPWIHRGSFSVPIQLETTHTFLLHGFTEGISQSLYKWKLFALSSFMDLQRVFHSPYTTGNYSHFPPPWIHRGYFPVPIQLETTRIFLLHCTCPLQRL